MKKILVLILPFILLSCFWWDKDEIQKAKEEIFSDNQTEIKTEEENITQNEETQIIKEDKNEKPSYELSKQNDFIDLEPITNIEKIGDELEIKWLVNNSDIDKIVVNFSNENSSFPKDNHTLSQYKKWDKTFIYRAYKRYEVLDKWINIYTIKAYIWEDEVSSIELKVIIPENEVKTISDTEKVVKNLWDENDNLFLSLPVNEETYWKPVMTSTDSFTYSNLTDFSAIKDSSSFDVTCENVDDYLKEKFSWYYWNTCRPISWENWLYVNVLTLIWDEYFYYRVYADKSHWIYSKVLLETWTWVWKDDLSEKNSELKNTNFDIISKTDSLFNDLLK